MRDMYWLREGLLAGSAGPNRSVWEIDTLKHHKIRGVLSLNDGALIRESELARNSIDYKCLPLPDRAPPEYGDVESCLRVLPEALEFVESILALEGPVLVHCSSGKDRTGLFLCYYLCRVEGCSAEEAIREIRVVRPIALTAPGWKELTYEVLRRSLA